jgi:hypothetical protein
MENARQLNPFRVYAANRQAARQYSQWRGLDHETQTGLVLYIHTVGVIIAAVVALLAWLIGRRHT